MNCRPCRRRSDPLFLKLFSLRGADEEVGSPAESTILIWPLLRRGKIFREITSPIVLRSVFQRISFEEFDPERKPGTRGNVRKIVKTSVRYSNETTKNILESGMANFTADIVLLLDSYSSPKRARGFYVKLIVLNRHTWTFESVRWFWWMWMTFIDQDMERIEL